jgi:endoglucanase
MAGSPGGLETTRAALARALKAQLDAAVATAGGDAWGFGRDWRSGDTTSHGDGLAVTADEVDAVRGDKAYDGYARNWLANVLGANPWGVSLIIGDGSTWTNCPQQQPANLLGSLTGGSPELWGAAVEGPTAEATSGGYDTMRPCPPGGGDAYATFDGNDGAFAVAKRAVYKDNVESYSTTEPAIDLTASSFLMFSWRQNGHPDDWTSTAAAALPGPASAHASFRVGATVTSTGADAPGGNVRFLLGGTGGRLLGQATLLRGPRSTSIAALRIPASALAPGANRIVAYYPGARGSQGPSTSLPVRLRVERG